MRRARRPLDLTAGSSAARGDPAVGEFTDVVLAIHHIAADGWSLRVLAGDLNLAYTARAAEQHPTGRRCLCNTPTMCSPGRYGSAVPTIRHPNSRTPGVLARGPRGRTVDAAPARTAPAVRPNCIGYRWTRHCCARSTGSPCGNTTRFAVVHAAPQSPLSRSGAGRDIIVGTPVAGRSDGDVVGLVGMFVSMVALRSDVDPQRGFGDLVVRSRETILDGLDHSAVDVEEVIDHLGIGQDGSRHPLIAVTLTVDADEHPVTTGKAAALTEAAVRIDLPVARFDPSSPSHPPRAAGRTHGRAPAGGLSRRDGCGIARRTRPRAACCGRESGCGAA